MIVLAFVTPEDGWRTPPPDAAHFCDSRIGVYSDSVVYRNIRDLNRMGTLMRAFTVLPAK